MIAFQLFYPIFFYLISFQFFYPILCGFNIQFRSQIHKFDTFPIPNTINTNIQACLVKHMENVENSGNLINVEGQIERGLL